MSRIRRLAPAPLAFLVLVSLQLFAPATIHGSCGTPPSGCAQAASTCPPIRGRPPCEIVRSPSGQQPPAIEPGPISRPESSSPRRGAVCSPSPTPENPLLLAELQVWHGLFSHTQAFLGAEWMCEARAYDSRDRGVIQRQIDLARAQGIDGFVVDWLGPGDATLDNHEERLFMDQALANLFSVAAMQQEPFCIAVLYDEVGLLNAGLVTRREIRDQAAEDLAYADQHYLALPQYLKLQAASEHKPVVFVFPHDAIDSQLVWPDLRAAFTRNEPNLLDLNPNPLDLPHDAAFDGFYAWVQPDRLEWDPLGQDWGRDYLGWFYDTMALDPFYQDKLVVGGIWPGFDDSFAPWTQPDEKRFMSRRGRQTYDQTLGLPEPLDRRPAIRMIATWNDYEEGSDTEAGIEMVVDMDETLQEILIRSAPFEVTWNLTTGSDVVQVYRDCELICETAGLAPPVTITLPSDADCGYEIKVFNGGPDALSRAVKVRRQDPDPTLVFFDDFESGDLSVWPP